MLSHENQVRSFKTPSGKFLAEDRPLEALPQLGNVSQSFSENEVFYCPEESYFYSYCLERFVLSACSKAERAVEFGAGDGTPIIHSLTRNPFLGQIHGYELNPAACQVANTRIERYGLEAHYVIHNQSFFDAIRPEASYLIANPPYLPAPDDEIQMPALRGGKDGSEITCRLLTLDYSTVLLMISSYSNPVDTIACAIAHDYYVSDFMVAPLQFGYYSSEAKVKNTIHQLKCDRQAFCSDNIYFLAGVLFCKQHKGAIDLSDELIRLMTAI
jgi:methylase of polypeptide subunit release factors